MKERVLKSWSVFYDKDVEIRLHENTIVKCKFNAIDGKQESIQVSNLETPMFTYPEAILRTSDILYITRK